MINDYTREIGMSSGSKMVPRWLAAIILLVLAIGAVVAIRNMSAKSSPEKDPVSQH